MITRSMFNEDMGTLKTTLEIDSDFKHSLILDTDDDTMLVLTFETMDERVLIPFSCRPEVREAAAHILYEAFEEIRQFLQEEE